MFTERPGRLVCCRKNFIIVIKINIVQRLPNTLAE
jgi:hypothetical protein